MSLTRLLLVLLLIVAGLPGLAQAPNQRLVLKDGSYQVVTKYQKVGDRVRYYSAERSQWEELPANLVDWAATEQYAKEHVPGAHPSEPQAPAAAPVNPEAVQIDKEEQEERARAPFVSPGLRLPDELGVWALDTYHNQPELVALAQSTGAVDRQTGHNVLRSALNPLGGMQQAVQIAGAEAKVRLHVDDPTLYVSLSVPGEVAGDSAVTVETHGAGSGKDPDVSSATSQYAVVRVRSNFKRNSRNVTGIKIGVAGKVTQTEDVIPTRAVVMPGNHWMKLTPLQPLTIGEYALMELLGPGEVNLLVWDFRIDPQSPDNKNALIPLQRE